MRRLLDDEAARTLAGVLALVTVLGGLMWLGFKVTGVEPMEPILRVIPQDIEYCVIEVEGRTCVVATYHLSVAIDCDEPQ